jgi:hypothetical protein
MPRVGFERTIPVFERAKIVHDLECAAIVTGNHFQFIFHKMTVAFDATAIVVKP